MRLGLKGIFLGVSLAAVLAGPASAVPISTLFSTGKDAGGAPLAEGAADPHYSLIAAPGGVGAATFVTVTDGFPIAPWLANSAISKWIMPQSGSSNNTPLGSYTYRTTFDLSGFIESTASFSFQMAADDRVTNVLLNGASLGFTHVGFAAFSGTFSVTSGFVAGVNTLDFLVTNAGGVTLNPSGLNVRITASNAVTAPEPGTMALALLGGATLAGGLVRRRRALG